MKYKFLNSNYKTNKKNKQIMNKIYVKIIMKVP